MNRSYCEKSKIPLGCNNICICFGLGAAFWPKPPPTRHFTQALPAAAILHPRFTQRQPECPPLSIPDPSSAIPMGHNGITETAIWARVRSERNFCKSVRDRIEFGPGSGGRNLLPQLALCLRDSQFGSIISSSKMGEFRDRFGFRITEN